MLIKLLDFPDDTADALKVFTGEATASKAVYRAADTYIANLEKIGSLKSHNELQAIEILRLRQLIESARFAAAALVDKTAQGDLL
jgi:hypothetical protein